MRATVLGIHAACTLAACILVASPVSLLNGARAEETAGRSAEPPATATAVTHIPLIGTLSDADRDVANAAKAIAARIDIMDTIGIRLGYEAAPGVTASGANPAAIQTRTKSAILKGEIKGAVLPLAAFLRQSALFGADQIPFLVVDAASNVRLIEILTPMIDDRLAEHGLALLGLLPIRPVGIIAAAPKQPGLPGKMAVDDAAGRRLAELIGATAIAMLPGKMPNSPIEARYAAIPDLDTPAGSRPGRHPGSDDHQLLALTGWPLVMIVVRRELVAHQFDAVRNELWREAARQADAIRQRWRTSMATPHWPTAATSLQTSMTTRGASGVLSNQRGEQSRKGHHAGLQPAHQPQKPAASADPPHATKPANSPTTEPDPESTEATARLRAAGLTMAREWAVGAGADGFAILKAIGLPVGEDR